MQNASVEAFLYLGNVTIPLDASHYEWRQYVDHRGRPRSKVRAGTWSFVTSRLDQSTYQHLLELMLSATAVVEARATYLRADGQGTFVTVWGRGCTMHHLYEYFDARGTNGQEPGWVLYFSLAAEQMGRETGTAGEFVMPAAGEYAYKAIKTASAKVTPIASGLVTVSRLPLITGDPPFKVTSRKKNKPDMDPVEFIRQVRGQQDGLNRLTVAEFMANRDHYIALSKIKKSGRDPTGDAAQKVAREEALRDKEIELRRQNRSLTKAEATVRAEQWLATQTALHDPDQVAGGPPHVITGMGDARVNFSIGAQWPKRIKIIDKQIRTYATNMSRQQLESTYLNIVLPIE
ncbi:polymorphic toxin type 15 domain-containing protein [Hymenobacter tibetensis]|uniref:Polymorphic toxin type 15 domain-containing protein n=1 Tax=Hymenobacter tibetensis TaxID=497967 RepID=A0ABY4D033_9BACT|nr:type VI secretion system tube protein TssD [Hymenobacter tibetensis]UOG75880.1 polymorphic toxin type 15 domain-containing protein [Hymenobacter tibetensis]